MPVESQVLTDRELQDAVIRYLSDAGLRRDPSSPLPISQTQAARAEKFARFLARRYYRDRIFRSFRYSHLFHEQLGRSAGDIISGRPFDEFLQDCVLGSLESARRVGKMAIDCLTLPVHQAPGPWWNDLLAYESAFFLQAATAEHTPAGSFARHAISAVVCNFQWDLPQLLGRLKSNQLPADVTQRSISLLFSRTREGRIYVVEIEGATAEVFRCINGGRSMEEVAAIANVTPAACQSILMSLEQIGAVLGSPGIS